MAERRTDAAAYRTNMLEGKIALVTGAGKGSGRRVARLLAVHGARVAANDVSPVNLDTLVQEGAGKIAAYPEDMAKKVGVQAVLKQLEDDFGRIDILINHAAVEPHVSLLEMDEWDWHRVLDVNLTGAFLTMQSAGRMMKQSGPGVIINLVSLEPVGYLRPAYEASTLGLLGLTAAAATELAGFGICVHAVGRGLQKYARAEPSVPRDLEGAVLYLATSQLTGQIVNVEAQ